jgi:hypothetical protein
MIDIENLSDIELSELQASYVKIKAACDPIPEGEQEEEKSAETA